MDENGQREGAEKRRALIAGGVMLSLVAAAGVGTFFLIGGNDSEEEQGSVEITAEQQFDIELQATDLVNELGNFGVDREQINEDNILFVANGMASDPSQFTGFIDTRADTYRAADDAIMTDSPADIDSRAVDQWGSTFETVTLSSFEVVDGSLEVEVSETGNTYDVKGAPMTAVKTNVSFDSVQSTLSQSRTDSDWDGSYIIGEKTYDVSMGMTFVHDGSQWSLYATDGPQPPFVLANWENPSYGEFMDEQQGADQVGTIVSTEVQELLKEMNVDG